MKKYLIFSVLSFLLFNRTQAQGCITIRNLTTSTGQYNLLDRSYVTSDWQINFANRYFVANRAYTGTKYNPSAPDFTNTTYAMDFGITRLLPKGWAIAIDIPLSANSRKTAFEHGAPGSTQYTTHSFGLNDISLTAYKWILAPHENQKFNFQLGLGIKFATGAYNYEDYFYRDDTTAVLAPVNPSIQLGDGGTGIITVLNTFYVFNKTWSLYGNFYYLFSPRDQNGVSNTFGRTPTGPQLKVQANVNSVPDTYSARAGVSAVIKRWIFSAGGRIEGAPVYDVLGQSHGLRRAGYNASIEPGAMYNFKTVSIYYYMPIIVGVDEMTVATDRELGLTSTTGGSASVQFIFGAVFKL